MEAVEIKTKIHNLIDHIDDCELLEDFYKTLRNYSDEDSRSDIIDPLTAEQLNRLDQSIQQSNNRRTIPHETVKHEIKRWLMRQNERKTGQAIQNG